MTVCAINAGKHHTWHFSKPSAVKRRPEKNSEASSLSSRNETEGTAIRDFGE